MAALWNREGHYIFALWFLLLLSGRTRETPVADGISAETLNNHYSIISTDPDYTAPRRKLSAKLAEDEYFSEWQVFRMLDRLRPTATGLDSLPAWFIKLGAPAFCKPITRLLQPVDSYLHCPSPMENSQH